MPKPSSLLDGYQYEPGTGRYRNLASGRFVARTRITDLLGDSISQNERLMTRLATEFHEGKLDPRAWAATQSAMLKREYLQNAALGAGGWDRLTARDYGRIGGHLGQEYGRLANMAEQIAAGEVTLPQALNRVHMEQGGAHTVYFETERDKLPKPEQGMARLERRVLGEAEHCDSCFIGGTMVLCQDGWKPIEQVQIGDQAATLDGWHTVTEKFSRHSNDLWVIETGNESVICTGNHPFMLADGNWVEARNLCAGQQVVTMQSSADIVNGQVAFPNAFDGIAASREISSLGSVPFLLGTLLWAQRLETRMSMPVIAVDFENDGANTKVAEELVANQILRFIDCAKGIKHFLCPFLCFAATVLLAYKAALQKVAHIFLAAFHSSCFHRLALFIREMLPRIGLTSASINQLGVGGRGESNLEIGGPYPDTIRGNVQQFGTFLRSVVRIVFSDKGILFGGPLVVAHAFAALPYMVISVDWASACLADIRRPLRPTVWAQSDLAHFNGPARTKVVRSLASTAKRMFRFDSAAGALHVDTSPMVYNLEVDHAHHYIANGFVVHNCVTYYEQGWQPEGTLPVPGEGSECLTNCRCSLIYKTVPANDAESLIGTKG